MKIAIAGYGNLAKKIEKQITLNNDIELVGIFTRRNTLFVHSDLNTPIYSFSVISKYADKVDVMLNCMGSANDLPVITPYLAKYYNLVDCFDNCNLLKAHITKTNRYATASRKLALVGCGINTVMHSVLEKYLSVSSTPYAKSTSLQSGVSATLSNAVKDIEGVYKAVVYISGSFTEPRYECIVVPYSVDNCKRIKYEIMSMSDYFKNSNIKVIFIDEDTFNNAHMSKAYCFETGYINNANDALTEISLTLSSTDILFETANLMLAYSKAVFKMNHEGIAGCITPLNVAPEYLK